VPWFDRLADATRTLNRSLAVIGMLLLLPLMLMTTLDVLSRGLFNRPLVGVYELSSYLLAGFVLLGIAFTYQEGGHVRIELLISHLPRRVAAMLDALTTLLSLAVVTILIWQGWKLGISETAVSEQLRIPEVPFRLLVPLAGLTLWMAMFTDLLEHLSTLLRR
jgi:TRAP-type transport system small permease protein